MASDGITLSVEDAAVVFDLAEGLSGPVSPGDAAFMLRQARYLLPKLVAAFEAADIVPDEVERPEIPFMVPGSKAISG
jgi:hypothetical protein